MRLAVLALCLVLAGCTSGSGAPASTTAPSGATVRMVAENLDVPWGIGFLPDGRALVTERATGRVVELLDDAVRTVATVPGAVAGGEGGLLGIAVSPTYAQDGLIFVYFTAADDNRIARMKLGGVPEPIVTGIPKSSIHNGGRLGFGPDGFLYASTGDGSERGLAQDRNSLGGKILRMTPDGEPAPGNPFGTLVYTYGHRNVQGFGWTADGQMYATEFGQNEWDELNHIVAGQNYGWPVVEGIGSDSRYTNPIAVWNPSDASCSGLAALRDSVIIGCLRGERLYQIPVPAGGPVTAYLTHVYGRLRTVVAAPDGTVWFTTSNRDGRGEPAAGDDHIFSLGG